MGRKGPFQQCHFPGRLCNHGNYRMEHLPQTCSTDRLSPSRSSRSAPQSIPPQAHELMLPSRGPASLGRASLRRAWTGTLKLAPCWKVLRKRRKGQKKRVDPEALSQARLLPPGSLPFTVPHSTFTTQPGPAQMSLGI